LNLPNIISASAGPNGSISPSGDVVVGYNAGQSFTITPDTGYHVADVIVDGSSIGAVTKYKFDNVTASHTISAAFAWGGTWYLEHDLTLENTPGTQSGFASILDGETALWLSNMPAEGNLTFTPGDWVLSLASGDWGAGGCTIQIGVSHGGVFKAFESCGVPAFSPYAGSIIVTIPTASAETIPQGDFLALSITNNSGGEQQIITDGSSFLSLPESDPGYPVPELGAGILLGFGLALTGFMVILQRKSQKNKSSQV
jgi:hypothetical protein